MAADYIVKQHDVPAPLRRVLKDGGAIVNLTGALAVRFRMTALDGTIKIADADAGVYGTATDGEVEYEWVEGDLDTLGWYRGEFKVSWTDERETFPGSGWISIQVVTDPAITLTRTLGTNTVQVTV